MAERGELTLIRLSSSSDEEEEETEMEVDRGKHTLIYLSSSSDEEENTEIEADRGKRTLICLSSSSDEDEDTEIEADRGKRTLICLSSSSDDLNYSGDGNGCNDDDDREMEYYGDCDDGHDAGDDDESICHRVICLLKDGSDLEVLNLQECKVYLRKHGLRLSEPKEVCIQRIMEHWRLKDRNGEALYPRSSFVINCTGDACKGDVVLFTQFHKLARHGGLLGKRTIAGRVVNESYGGAKQKHTFTVEVLWSKSKGLGTLPPLLPLLVKGCKLYRFKTYRQRWDDEAERLKVLSEKHKRGAEARHKRAMKRTKMRPYSKGAKRQKYSTHTVPTPKKKAIETRKTKYLSMRGKALPQHHQRSRQLNFKRAPRSYATNLSGRSQRLKHHNINDCPTLQPYFRCPKPHQSQMRFYDGRTPFYFSSHDMAPNSIMMRLPPLRSDADPLPTSFCNLYNGNYSRHAGKFRMELHQKVVEKFATTKTTSYREIVECAQMTEKSDMDTNKYYAVTRPQKRGGSSSSRSGGEKKTTTEQSSEQRPEQRIDRRPDRKDDRDYRARGCRGKGFRRGDRERNPRRPIVVCVNCGQQGHHSNECIDWNCDACFWCGQLGHQLKDCLVRGFGQQAQQEQHTLLPALQQRALHLANVGHIQALPAPVPPAQQHGAPGRVFALGYEAAPMDQQGIRGEFIEDYQRCCEYDMPWIFQL